MCYVLYLKFNYLNIYLGIKDANEETILQNYIPRILDFGYFNGKHAFVMTAFGDNLLQISRNKDGSIKKDDHGSKYKAIMTDIVKFQ